MLWSTKLKPRRLRTSRRWKRKRCSTACQIRGLHTINQNGKTGKTMRICVIYATALSTRWKVEAVTIVEGVVGPFATIASRTKNTSRRTIPRSMTSVINVISGSATHFWRNGSQNWKTDITRLKKRLTLSIRSSPMRLNNRGRSWETMTKLLS